MNKKSYHHGELRKALVDAAASLAAEHGPESVSLREVAKRAGVSHAAPYHHFRSKAELLHAVALEGERLMDVGMKRAWARRHRTPVDRLFAMGRAYIQFAVRHPHYFRAMFRGVTPDEGLPDALQLGQRNFDALITAVQACIGETGRPTRRARGLILTAWTIVHGMASLAVERGFRDTPFERSSVNELSRLAMDAVRPIFKR